MNQTNCPTARRVSAFFVTFVAFSSALPSALAERIPLEGGGRPAEVLVPENHDPGAPIPLLFLLHGRGGDGEQIDRWWQMSSLAEEHGVLVVRPDSLVAPGFGRVWDALGHYCPDGDVELDDSAYLQGLVDEIEDLAGIEVDRDRIGAVGYSLGGRMAYRLACEHADTFTAAVSFAGTNTPDLGSCPASRPIHSLHIHGTADGQIDFDGGVFGPFPACSYPGAEETFEQWAAIAECSDEVEVLDESLDLDGNVPGPETSVTRALGCTPGGSSELWVLEGSGHGPDLIPNAGSTEFSTRIFDWFLSHPRRESPVAEFSAASESGAAPFQLEVDASSSSAPSDVALRYFWDFGDGAKGRGVTASHTYGAPGIYIASLVVVTDEAEPRSSIRKRLTVSVGCPRADTAPWEQSDIGESVIAGGARFDDGVLVACSAGSGIGATRDRLLFVHQAFSGDGRITARVPGLDQDSVYVGVQFRSSLDPDASFAAAALEVAGGLFTRRRFRSDARDSSGAGSVDQAGDDARGGWLRVERQGQLFVSEVSSDGVEWALLSETTLEDAPETMLVGVAVGNNSTSDESVDARLTDLELVATRATPLFRRADCNFDLVVDISDPVAALGFLFLGEERGGCVDACDANDDGVLDISDPITTLNALFLGSATIPAPGMEACGEDPTEDDLDCAVDAEACE